MKKIILTVLVGIITISCVTAGGNSQSTTTQREQSDWQKWGIVDKESIVRYEDNPFVGRWVVQGNENIWIEYFFNEDLTYFEDSPSGFGQCKGTYSFDDEYITITNFLNTQEDSTYRYEFEIWGPPEMIDYCEKMHLRNCEGTNSESIIVYGRGIGMARAWVD